MARNQKVQPLKSTSDRGVFFSLTIDRRKPSKDSTNTGKQKYPIAVLVCHAGRNVWFRTGLSVTETEYAKMLKASNQGTFFEEKCRQIAKFDSAVKQAGILLDSDSFTLATFKDKLKGKTTSFTFSGMVRQVIEDLFQAGRVRTASNYQSILTKFEGYYGNNVKFDKISPQLATDFMNRLKKENLSDTSINIYMRTLRIFCNIALEKEFLKPVQNPFGQSKNRLKIPKAAKRKDRYLTIPEILHLIEYDVPENRENSMGKLVCESINFWLFSYLANGMNLADIAELKYTNHYFKTHGKELEFIRKKTERTSSNVITIYIPVIPQLKAIIDKYGVSPKLDSKVFPQIIGNETDEKRIMKIVDQFGKNISSRISRACEIQGLDSGLTMTWARHSFNTNLAHKRVPESYISQAMGHSMESITAGYTGFYSTEDRFRYNSLLLEPDKHV